MLSLIAAMTPERVIGLDGDMPWHLPADLAWFKRNTLEKPIIMGRKTWASIGCKPLPKRRNIVISRDTSLTLTGAELVDSPDSALALVDDASEVMIIGGAQIYSHFLPQADRLYITLIHASVEGDSWFPAYDQMNWRQSSCENLEADDKNPHACSFMVLDRLP